MALSEFKFSLSVHRPRGQPRLLHREILSQMTKKRGGGVQQLEALAVLPKTQVQSPTPNPHMEVHNCL